MSNCPLGSIYSRPSTSNTRGLDRQQVLARTAAEINDVADSVPIGHDSIQALKELHDLAYVLLPSSAELRNRTLNKTKCDMRIPATQVALSSAGVSGHFMNGNS